MAAEMLFSICFNLCFVQPSFGECSFHGDFVLQTTFKVAILKISVLFSLTGAMAVSRHLIADVHEQRLVQNSMALLTHTHGLKSESVAMANCALLVIPSQDRHHRLHLHNIHNTANAKAFIRWPQAQSPWCCLGRR